MPAVAKIATGQVVVATELFDDVLALLAKNVALNECMKVQVAKYIINLECGGWGGGGRGNRITRKKIHNNSYDHDSDSD